MVFLYFSPKRYDKKQNHQLQQNSICVPVYQSTSHRHPNSLFIKLRSPLESLFKTTIEYTEYSNKQRANEYNTLSNLVTKSQRDNKHSLYCQDEPHSIENVTKTKNPNSYHDIILPLFGPTRTPSEPLGLTRTHSNSIVPIRTHSYPLIPTRTHWYPLVPTRTHSYPIVPPRTHSYPLLPI